MVDQTGVGWNQLAHWLKSVDAVRAESVGPICRNLWL